jgi:hypothetical protein
MLNIAFVAIIALQTPSQQAPDGAKSIQTQPRDERGTAQLPLVVRTIPTPQSQAETDAAQAELDRKHSSDMKIIVLTGALVGATILLGIVGIVQWNALRQHAKHFERLAAETTKVAEAAASSAKTAKASLEIVDRPYIETDDWSVTAITPTSFGVAYDLVIGFHIRNLGSTAAQITRTNTNFGFSGEEGTHFDQNHDAVLGPKSFIPIEHRITLKGSQDVEYLDSGLVLRVWGKIDYLDRFGNSHWKKFGRLCRCHVDGSSFSVIEGGGLNSDDGWEQPDQGDAKPQG